MVFPTWLFFFFYHLLSLEVQQGLSARSFSQLLSGTHRLTKSSFDLIPRFLVNNKTLSWEYCCTGKPLRQTGLELSRVISLCVWVKGLIFNGKSKRFKNFQTIPDWVVGSCLKSILTVTQWLDLFLWKVLLGGWFCFH